MTKFENFKTAFSPPVGSCQDMCKCGREFYNPDISGWDFGDGELERLEADSDAIALDYPVGYVEFEGDRYVWDCNCWIKRADRLIGFINGHAFQIADYLTREKERKTDEAKVSPVVG